jgi:opacity protein-like surface antigen
MRWTWKLLGRLLAVLTWAALVPAVCPSPAAAAAGLVGIDAMTATVLQEGQSSFSGVALRLRIQSPMFVPGVEILPTLEYWRNTNNVEPFGISTTRKDATLGGDIRYAFRPSGWRPYLGAGYGLHFLSSAVDAPSLGVNHESHALVKGGLAAMGGVTFAFAGKVDNFLELKYHHVAGYRQLKINWGLSLNL